LQNGGSAIGRNENVSRWLLLREMLEQVEGKHIVCSRERIYIRWQGGSK
jgi:hypothetical protein